MHLIPPCALFNVMHTGGWASWGQRLCAINLGCLARLRVCMWSPLYEALPHMNGILPAPLAPNSHSQAPTPTYASARTNKPSGQSPKVDKPFQKYYLCHCCSYFFMPGNSYCVFQLKSNVTRQLLPEALASIPGSFPCNVFNSTLTPL